MRFALVNLLLLAAVMMSGCAAAPVTDPHRPEAPPVIETPEEPAAPAAEPLPTPTIAPAPADLREPTQSWGLAAEEIFRFAAREGEHLSPRLEHYRQQRQSWRQLAVDLEQLVPEGEWPEPWRRCLAQLQAVAADYEKARELLRDLEFAEAALWSEAVAAVNAAYRADLAFTTQECGQYYHLAEKTVAARLATFHDLADEQLQAIMLHYARRGDGNGVRQTLTDWRRLYPGSTLPLAAGREIGLALFRAGEQELALSLLAEQEEAMAPLDALAIARLRGDLLLIAGRSHQARRQYERIAARHAALDDQRQWVSEQLRLLHGQLPVSEEERELFLALLGEAVLYDGRSLPAGLAQSRQRLEERFPAGLLTFRARRLADEIERRAGDWFQEQIGKVEERLAEGGYDEAISRLRRLREENLQPAQLQQVRSRLATAEESRREAEELRRQLEQQALVMQWEEADRLLGLGQYDEAIAAFARLLESEYADRARRRMAEAARQAAAELRREAAAIFVQARRSDDPGRAAELASESWQLLQRIVTTYPDNEIIARVMDNLALVEEYLERLDAERLEELRQESGAAGEGERLFDNR